VAGQSENDVLRYWPSRKVSGLDLRVHEPLSEKGESDLLLTFPEHLPGVRLAGVSV
jgi:hypothetical protein